MPKTSEALDIKPGKIPVVLLYNIEPDWTAAEKEEAAGHSTKLGLALLEAGFPTVFVPVADENLEGRLGFLIRPDTSFSTGAKVCPEFPTASGWWPDVLRRWASPLPARVRKRLRSRRTRPGSKPCWTRPASPRPPGASFTLAKPSGGKGFPRSSSPFMSTAPPGSAAIPLRWTRASWPGAFLLYWRPTGNPLWWRISSMGANFTCRSGEMKNSPYCPPRKWILHF